MANIVHFPTDIIPTQTVFSRPWKIERYMNAGGIVQYDGMFTASNGRGLLYVTILGTRYPQSKDFVDGELLECVPPGGSLVQAKGPVQVHSHTQQVGNYWITTYSFTADMAGLMP